MTERDDRSKADFASKKFAWIEAVGIDDRISAHRKIVGILILSMVNRIDGYTWASLATIAAASCGSEKAARDAINDLEKLGYLTTRRGGGRDRSGRAITNRIWPLWVESKTPLADALKARREGMAQHLPSLSSEGTETREPPLESDEPPLSSAPSPHRAVTQTLQLNPTTIEPGSATNVAADAVAPASQQDDWKGSDGDRIPAGFPDQEAMQDACMWSEVAGVELDLKHVRKTFLNHHFAVRCRQRDWEQSWERWVNQAIDEARA